MKNEAKSILVYSGVAFAVVALPIVLFMILRSPVFIFLPLIGCAICLYFAPMPATLGVLITYFAFEGMLKILSGYNPVIHVASDILVLITTVRWVVLLGLSGTTSRVMKIPFFTLFVIHGAWVAVEIFNPFGLGLVAGLAAFKVYLTFVILYFIAFFALNDPQEFRALVLVTILLLIPETIVSAYQFSAGAKSLLSISPNYAKPMNNVFIDAYFRPFGLSAVPGGPATWCFLTLPLLIGYILMDRKWLRRLPLIALTFFTIYVLFISQVRASVIKALIAVALMYLFANLRRPMRLAWGFVIGTLTLASIQSVLYSIESPLFEVAKQRFAALTSFGFITSQRGQGVIDAITYIWSHAPFGIGLSRVGAASGVFIKDINANPFYGAEWTFADNLYRAITVELGIPGSIFYLLLVLCPVTLIMLRLIRSKAVVSDSRFLVAGSCGLAVASILGYWGSEASLYLPECAYFWIFTGAAMKFSESQYLNPRPVHERKS